LLIHARLTEEFRISHFTFGDSHLDSDDLNEKREMRNVKCKINFTLNENPLSELADSEGNVISGLKLSIPDAGENSEMVKWQNGEILVYPNPAKEILNIEYQIFNPVVGTSYLELINLHGIAVIKCKPVKVVAGYNSHQLDLRGILPGIYFLKIAVQGNDFIRKVVIGN
jgi:hypothetical protein